MDKEVKDTKDVKDSERDPFLAALGERILQLRVRRGMTRKTFAASAGLSERHPANLEYGIGNASILILQQITTASCCSLAEIVGDMTTSSPEWLLIRDLLGGRSEEELRRARVALSGMFEGNDGAPRQARIALIGLRGAGKSTLGRMLAEDMGRPIVELNRETEQIAGCSIAAIHSLYGENAYRRYERRALEQTLQLYLDAVIATPGGLVSEPATFNLLMTNCFTVWLQASPEEHMQRVVEQSDFRPMDGHAEAMTDLRRILDGRTPFYAKADMSYDTSGKTLEESFQGLRLALGEALRLRAAA
ncbi:MAG: helix-turn-helix transcriptional regulator [Candidatus Protistobacter heckmanni]|nr:helix-turn-helix transcriptional regulator [Candidatus Protistobacter heckmanni]